MCVCVGVSRGMCVWGGGGVRPRGVCPVMCALSMGVCPGNSCVCARWVCVQGGCVSWGVSRGFYYTLSQTHR